MKSSPCFLGQDREAPSDLGVRHPKAEHLLRPNWSLQQLMASCGYVFTSHLFCMHCFLWLTLNVSSHNFLVSFCLSSSFLPHKRCCLATSTWLPVLFVSLLIAPTPDFPLSPKMSIKNI